MKKIRHAIKDMISISDEELDGFLKDSYIKTFKKNEIISFPNTVPNDIFFINKGIIRALLIDNKGLEHTTFFGVENQFIADYACFILKKLSIICIQALEETEIVVTPRSSIEWGYQNIRYGDRLGRLIAEYYFIYQDDVINSQYYRTPKERYDNITSIFPNIHNRVPQHMIASYLGISPVHLSRLKKTKISKT
ncbi:Crp/Fnr family transcriptional regulator [Flavobacterium sp.]|jgi:CRP-like cAMP-binding protein|uniref:Crp/Fnr family transcriptional regulator n=1 Tax=Flavobacterium sp. TaxID=239 RepID=UPI0037C17D45